jgi:hypothetical protein
MRTRIEPVGAALDASIEIAATADEVWRVVRDVRRTGEWSPECRRVIPIGPVRRGCLLLGLNRHGGTRWATISRVTRCEAGREIAWRVLTNKSEWSHTIRANGAGCVLSSARRTPRGIGSFAGWFTSRYLGGQQAHDAELVAGMQTGLRRIKAIVEG